MDKRKKMRVLLIGGDAADAALFRSLLTAEDKLVDLHWTERLSSALERMTTETFDVVVTDLELPDSEGIETFMKIHSQFPFEPIVVLTSFDNQDLAIEAVQKGAQDYLIKGRAKGDSILRLLRYSIERQRLITECEKNLREIKTLRGLIPMCAWCHKVHSHKGYWEKVEKYIEEQTDASFTHSICPECIAKVDPEMGESMKQEAPERFETGQADPSKESGIRLLLIEDNPSDAALVRGLADEVKDVAIAINHVDRLAPAVELLHREPFDIVLCDLGLPDSEGIETFIKINTLVPDVPIVILTGTSDKELAATAVRSGAEDYIVKGEVDSSLLGKAIQYAIERHKMLKALRSNLREIGKLQKEREIILSTFAHDIKNAVMPAAWLLKRILSGKSHPADNDIAAIRDGLKSAEKMLADFIEFSRFETREYKPAFGPFDIEAAVRHQVAFFNIEAAEKNMKITFEFSEPFPILKADKEMMQRVISNLLDNAVKYSPKGGAVHVKVRKLEDNIVVQVQDTGIGIPEDHISHIFDSFYRAPGTEKGSGLGLSIAKTIVKAHSGEIWVKSTPGHGSTFSFTLPLQ